MADTFRAVIFDLGGVVFPSPFEAFDVYDARAGLEPGQRARADPHEQRDRRVGRARAGRAHDRRVRDRARSRGGRRRLRARRPRADADGRRRASAPRPAMLHAIERIRAHGLRTAALTNNWVATDGRRVAERLRARSRSTSSSSRRSRACASPTRASTSSCSQRLDVRAVGERLPRRPRHQPQAGPRARA